MTQDDSTANESERQERLARTLAHHDERLEAIEGRLETVGSDSTSGPAHRGGVPRRSLLGVIGMGGLLGAAAGGASAQQGNGGGSQNALVDVSDDGSKVVTDTRDINFSDHLDVTDDNDQTATVDADPDSIVNAANAAGHWVDGDNDDLLEPTGTKTGIEDIETIQAGTGNSLSVLVNDEDALVVTPPSTSVGNAGSSKKSPNLIRGHPNNNTDGASPTGATIGGGGSEDRNINHGPNVVSGNFATIGGGTDNTATSGAATVGGGRRNEADDNGTTIGGGKRNSALGGFATVAGGEDNEASGPDDHSWSTVGGGRTNKATGQYATVPGGDHNTASGRYSFAAGRETTAKHDGAFVFGDSSGTGIQSQNADEVRSQMPMYAPSFNTTSARAKKEAFEPVDPEAVLDAITDLEVGTWTLKHNSGGRHMGPMAEDFHDAFGLGDDDGHIASVDADGVAFAAIQGISQRLGAEISALREVLAEKDDRIERLEAEKQGLEGRLAAVEEHIGLGGPTAQSIAAD